VVDQPDELLAVVAEEQELDQGEHAGEGGAEGVGEQAHLGDVLVGGKEHGQHKEEERSHGHKGEPRAVIDGCGTPEVDAHAAVNEDLDPQGLILSLALLTLILALFLFRDLVAHLEQPRFTVSFCLLMGFYSPQARGVAVNVMSKKTVELLYLISRQKSLIILLGLYTVKTSFYFNFKSSYI